MLRQSLKTCTVAACSKFVGGPSESRSWCQANGLYVTLGGKQSPVAGTERAFSARPLSAWLACSGRGHPRGCCRGGAAAARSALVPTGQGGEHHAPHHNSGAPYPQGKLSPSAHLAWHTSHHSSCKMLFSCSDACGRLIRLAAYPS